jgi:DNA-binding protein HU-beta
MFALRRLSRPLVTHTLVLLLAACGATATITADCSGQDDGLDDAALYEVIPDDTALSALAVAAPNPMVLTKADIINLVSDKTGLTLKQSGEAVASMLDVVVDGLKNKKTVMLPGLGSLTYKVRPARNYTNPKTGAIISRPVAGYVGWKTASILKSGLPTP